MKTQRFAKNQSELARLIGESRQWVALAAKREGVPAPRDDGRLDVEAWKAFRDETKSRSLDTPDLIELKRLIAAEDLRKKKAFNDEEDGALVRKEVLIKEAGQALAQIIALTYQKLEHECPTVMSEMDIPSNRIIGRRYAEELINAWKAVFQKLGV